MNDLFLPVPSPCKVMERTLEFCEDDSRCFKVLRWLHELGMMTPTKEMMKRVIRTSNVRLLDWMLTRHKENGTFEQVWTFKMTNYAANAGKLYVLHWLHERGCPLDVNACLKLAKNGRFERMENWLTTV